MVSYLHSGKPPLVTSLPAFSNKQITKNTVSLSVYPNPTQDYVNIERSGNGILLVSDVTDKVVHQVRLADNSTYTLPTFAWQRGIYIITWQNEEGVVRKSWWLLSFGQKNRLSKILRQPIFLFLQNGIVFTHIAK